MKVIMILWVVLMCGAVNAMTPVETDTRKAVYDALLAENRITQLEYQRHTNQLAYESAQWQQQQAVPLSTESIQGGTASVSGTVQSGAVVQDNVELRLLEVGSNQQIGFTTTDVLGTFAFSGLPPGDYFVLANNPLDDFIDAMYSSAGTVQCQYCQPDVNSTIVVPDGATVSGIDLDLVVGATVNGQVTEGVNNVAGISVRLRSTDNQTHTQYVLTDGSGDFSVKGVPAGDYYVTVADAIDDYIDAMYASTGTVQCSNCIPDVDSTLTLALAEIRNGVNFNLVIGATITGQLVDVNSTDPVETLSVNLFDPNDFNNSWFTQTVFDGSGNYSLSGIPAGDYKLYLSPSFESNLHIPEVYDDLQCNACTALLFDGAGSTLTLTNGVTTPNIDFLVEVGASISGIILNNDYPTETVEEFALVYVFNDANRVMATQFMNGTNYDPLFDGQYTVGGLLPGMYFVQGGDLGREFFQRELFENIACPWSGCDRGAGGDPVVLGTFEQRLGVNFLLNYGGKITGTVTDAVSGLPISNPETQYLQFYDDTGAVAGGAFIRPDGTYSSARALPPGDYSVRTGTMFNGVFNSPYVMEKYDMAGNIDCPGVTCDLTAGNVTVTAYERLDPRDPVAEAAAATTTGIDFALSTGFSFSGVITELGSATPIPDVHVLVYDDSGQFANWATTDAAGAFTVFGLPAGTYYALTNNGSNLPFMGLNQTEAGGWIDILYDGTPCPGSACDVTTGDPIVLGGPTIEGNQFGGVSFDFGLDAGGTITGQIRNFNDQLPASGVNVNVYNSDGDFYGSYQTDSSGNYMTVGFPPGTYYLTTSNNGALLDAMYGGAYCVNQSCDPLDADPLVITGNEALVGIDFDLRPDFIFKTGME